VHRPWQEVDVQEGGLTPLLWGCLSLGPPAAWHIAPLLQECSAWETVPALVTIRMTTWLTRNDRTHRALLPTALLITGFIADFRGAKSAHILHRNLQCFSRILLLFVSGFSFLTSWIVTPLFRYSHRIVEAQKALCA
jgi:hypothetical protein